jgi:hypothetical protein
VTTIYDHYLQNPPITDSGYPDRGSTARHAFWNGYNGSPAQGSPNSSARLAWRAGKRANRLGNETCLAAIQKLRDHTDR